MDSSGHIFISNADAAYTDANARADANGNTCGAEANTCTDANGNTCGADANTCTDANGNTCGAEANTCTDINTCSLTSNATLVLLSPNQPSVSPDDVNSKESSILETTKDVVINHPYVTIGVITVLAAAVFGIILYRRGLMDKVLLFNRGGGGAVCNALPNVANVVNPEALPGGVVCNAQADNALPNVPLVTAVRGRSLSTEEQLPNVPLVAGAAAADGNAQPDNALPNVANIVNLEALPGGVVCNAQADNALPNVPLVTAVRGRSLSTEEQLPNVPLVAASGNDYGSGQPGSPSTPPPTPSNEAYEVIPAMMDSPSTSQESSPDASPADSPVKFQRIFSKPNRADPKRKQESSPDASPADSPVNFQRIFSKPNRADPKRKQESSPAASPADSPVKFQRIFSKTE